MATEGTFQHDGSSWTAAADLSAKQFYAVKQTAARSASVASTGGESILGILLNKPTSGQACDIAYAGQTKARAGVGGWTAGDSLETEAGTGKLITQTTGNDIVAEAIETVVADDIGAISLRQITAA